MSSHYTQKKEGENAVFEILPAATPRSKFAMVAFISLVVIALLLGFMGSPIGTLMFFSFSVPFLIVMIAEGASRKRKQNQREPFFILVSDTTISVKDKRFAIDKIKEIQVGHTNSGPSANQYVDLRSSASMVGYNARMRQEAREAHVGYQVLARLAGDSRLHLLAGGLTEQTANALTSDLIDEIEARRA